MKVCFVGQKLYFSKQVDSGVEDAVWLEVYMTSPHEQYQLLS